MRKNKTKIYMSKTIIPTKEEKEYYDDILRKQVLKYKNDSKCGVVDGNQFLRLYDRNIKN